MDIIQSVAVPLAVLLTGGYFLIKTKAFFIFDPGRFFRALAYKDDNGGGKIKATTLALAGTLGVGNIVGVYGAIKAGGAGALFWMWISTVFAMVIKYAEVTLALKSKNDAKKRKNDGGGGAMYYITSPFLSLIFTLLCLVCSLSLGSAIQSGAVGEGLEYTFGISPYIGCTVIALLTFLVISGGKKRLFDTACLIVPLMTVIYTLMCVCIIIFYRNRLLTVFHSIISSAFNFKAVSAGGGLAAIRYGVIRGLISNEAGCGTAPIAHATSNTSRPAAQGCMGILEVFVDTALLCSLTGIAILSSGREGEGMEGIINCFIPLFGRLSGVLITVCIVFFAFATMVCWFYYGNQCICRIFGKSKKASLIFSLIFCASAAVSVLIPSEIQWGAADISVAFMTLINLSALLARRKEIIGETAYLT